MAKVLPARKQNKKAIHKVMKAVKNHHVRTPVKYSNVKKGSNNTGLVK